VLYKSTYLLTYKR